MKLKSKYFDINTASDEIFLKESKRLIYLIKTYKLAKRKLRVKALERTAKRLDVRYCLKKANERAAARKADEGICGVATSLALKLRIKEEPCK
jgi:hypothetical protein